MNERKALDDMTLAEVAKEIASHLQDRLCDSGGELLTSPDPLDDYMGVAEAAAAYSRLRDALYELRDGEDVLTDEERRQLYDGGAE